MTVWAELDLIVRRYVIGEMVAQEYPLPTVRRAVKQYVHLTRKAIRA